MRRRPACLVLVLALSVCTTGFAAETHPFDVHDLVAMERIGDPRPSPDGSVAAFVVTTMDLEANRGGRNLWLAATDGSSTSKLTSHTASDWSPRWADGRQLYFLSTRSGSTPISGCCRPTV